MVATDPQPLFVPGPFRRALIVVGDLLAVAVVAVSIPFVLLAVAAPLVLCAALLLWLTGLR